MSQHLISTVTKIHICRCGAVILVGLAEGLWTRVDPFPTDRLTEAAALIRGRWCFTLTPGRVLERRTGGQRRGPVLVEHRCGQPLTYLKNNDESAIERRVENFPPY